MKEQPGCFKVWGILILFLTAFIASPWILRSGNGIFISLPLCVLVILIAKARLTDSKRESDFETFLKFPGKRPENWLSEAWERIISHKKKGGLFTLSPFVGGLNLGFLNKYDYEYLWYCVDVGCPYPTVYNHDHFVRLLLATFGKIKRSDEYSVDELEKLEKELNSEKSGTYRVNQDAQAEFIVTQKRPVCRDINTAKLEREWYEYKVPTGKRKDFTAEQHALIQQLV